MGDRTLENERVRKPEKTITENKNLSGRFLNLSPENKNLSPEIFSALRGGICQSLLNRFFRSSSLNMRLNSSRVRFHRL